jgi:copper chaperone CopZ
MPITLTIGGMSCGHCIAAVAAALEAVDGIRVNHVSLGRADVALVGPSSTLETVTSAIERAGYTVASAER